MNIDLQKFYEDAIANGDEDRAQMVFLLRQVVQLISFNTERALGYLDELDDVLRRVDEPCWVLLSANLRWELLMMRNDFSAMLDVSAKATVEARKPRYDSCEERIDTHVSLATSYMYLDPLGYREKILDVLVYLLKQNLPNHILVDVYTRWSFVETINENYDEAERYANLAMDSVDEENDRSALISCYTAWCGLELQRKNFARVIDYGARGMDLTLASHFQPYFFQFQAWSVLAYQKNGDDAHARLLYVLSLQKMKQPGLDVPYVVPALLSVYCVEINDLEQALDFARQSLTLSGRSPYALAFAHVVLCYVLGVRDELQAQHLNEARDVINRLIAPQKLLDKIERVRQGDYTIW